jgi:hypothetical protein
MDDDDFPGFSFTTKKGNCEKRLIKIFSISTGTEKMSGKCSAVTLQKGVKSWRFCLPQIFHVLMINIMRCCGRYFNYPLRHTSDRREISTDLITLNYS